MIHANITINSFPTIGTTPIAFNHSADRSPYWPTLRLCLFYSARLTWPECLWLWLLSTLKGIA